MIVRVHIYAEHPLQGDTRVCTTGYFGMVSVDKQGQPMRCRDCCWRMTPRAPSGRWARRSAGRSIRGGGRRAMRFRQETRDKEIRRERDCLLVSCLLSPSPLLTWPFFAL